MIVHPITRPSLDGEHLRVVDIKHDDGPALSVCLNCGNTWLEGTTRELPMCAKPGGRNRIPKQPPGQIQAIAPDRSPVGVVRRGLSDLVLCDDGSLWSTGWSGSSGWRRHQGESVPGSLADKQDRGR